MIQTSSLFASLLDTAPSRLHLMLADNSEVPAAAIKSTEWSGGSNAGDDITLGSTVATQLQVALDRAKLGGMDLADARINAALTLDGAEDEIPVAVLQVDDVDGDDDSLTVTACDAMIWAFGVPYALDDAVLGFDWTAGVDGETLLQAICDACGVPLHTTGLPAITLTLVDASGYTYREVIAFLACMWGRFARIDGQGGLVLQWYTAADRPIGPDRYYEGELTKADYDYTVGYIKCYVEPLEETLTAGDTSKSQGIYIKCPWMTPERLQAVWEAIGGFTYRPVSGLRFLGDPRLEPGDVLQVTDRDGTLYSVPCMTLRHEFDGGLISEITAVGKSSSASEADYEGPVTRMIERAVEGIKTSLIRYQDRIEAKVEGMDDQVASLTLELDSIAADIEGLDGRTVSLELDLDGITADIEDLDGRTASLELGLDGISAKVTDNTNAIAALDLYVDSLTLSVSNGSTSSTISLKAGTATIASKTITFSGVVTFSDLSTAGATTINGSNITTGTLYADYIKLYGDLYVYTTRNAYTVGGFLGYTTSTLDGSAGIHMMNSYGTGEVRVTNIGAAMEGPGGGKIVCTGNCNITGSYIYFYAGAGSYEMGPTYFAPMTSGNRYCGLSGQRWSTVYCVAVNQSSDRSLKIDISYDLKKYRPLLLGLKPCSYKFNWEPDGPTRTGFVADDVDETLAAVGLSRADFAGLSMSDKPGESGLDYTALIALIVDALQDLYNIVMGG